MFKKIHLSIFEYLIVQNCFIGSKSRINTLGTHHFLRKGKVKYHCISCKNEYFYCPSMKFWEGNVFTVVCLSFCLRGVPCDHYRWLHCIAPIPGPHPSRHGIWDPPPLLVRSGGQHWRHVQTCSLENPNQYWHLVATKAHMVGEQVVCMPTAML